MLTQFVYSIFKITLIAMGERSIEDATVDHRFGDILSILISLSNMIMLYGVSDSVKSTIDRQVREDRILSSLDDIITEGSTS